MANYTVITPDGFCPFTQRERERQRVERGGRIWGLAFAISVLGEGKNRWARGVVVVVVVVDWTEVMNGERVSKRVLLVLNCAASTVGIGKVFSLEN